MSIIVLGELFAGFRGGTRMKENRARLAGFLAKPTVRTLELSTETAEVYGQIKDALKKAGTPIPINDVWLSAQAIETGSVLITFDNHFGNVARGPPVGPLTSQRSSELSLGLTLRSLQPHLLVLAL